LLRIDEAFTYLPLTCEMTLAYSFSAPIAVMAAVDEVEAAPEVPLDDDEDEQALARRAAASGRASARAPVRFLITLGLPVCGGRRRRDGARIGRRTPLW
jgi:hypothetical protein